MLRDVHKPKSSLEEFAQGGNSKSPMAQQSSKLSKSPNKRRLKNHQVSKLIKLEKIIGKFSKDIGFT